MAKKKKKKTEFIATTIYLPPDLKIKVKEYKKKKGYGTMSEVFRRAFFILTKVFPLETPSSESEEKSLFNRLDAIEQKLQDIKIEKELEEKEIETLEKRQILLKRASLHIKEENIEEYDRIKADIIETLKDLGPLKDFVLMSYLGDKYERGKIWSILVKLQEQNKLKIKKGKWSLKKGDES